MRDQLLGAIQPMLSILLDPGESVIGEASRFAWMTDSIEMTVADETGVCVYTATGEPGVVAFASRRPGRILTVDVGPKDNAYLIRRSGFVAQTSGVEVQVDSAAHGLALWRISGSGRAWVEMPGASLAQITGAALFGDERHGRIGALFRGDHRAIESRRKRIILARLQGFEGGHERVDHGLFTDHGLAAIHQALKTGAKCRE